MATPYPVYRTHRRAAKRRHASSSVAPVVYGVRPMYALRPSLACFSRPESTTYVEGDR